MKLDIANDQVVLELGQTQLKNDQKLQLGFWFKKTGDTYKANDLKVLPKVIRYLEDEHLNFNLSERVNIHLSQEVETTKAHANTLEVALGFKDGHYEEEAFVDFTHSLGHLVKRKLKDHQIKSTYHLSLIGNGANFSVPGSGKTTVVLTYFQKLRTEGKVNTLFVVGPPACFFPWKDEYKEVLGTTPRAKILSGMQKESRLFAYNDVSEPYDIYLITFQTLLNDSDEIKKFLSNPEINALLVIDEAHYMKRVDGNWANAVLNIADAASYRCALTGTPIPRSYMDLLNLVQFLWPHNNPLSSQDKARLQIYEENKDFENAAKLLEPKIGPLFYRVRKKDLGLKLPIFNKPILVKMHPNERILYDAIVNKIRDYSQEDYLKNIDVVTRLRKGRMIRLRQSLSYSRLLISALDDYKEDVLAEKSDLKELLLRYDRLEKPAKLEVLLARVKELKANNQKVVIWSNFIGTIDLMMKVFQDEGLYSKKITGSVPAEREKVSTEETREKVRDEFVDPNSGLDILIANPAACAESISLHKTCHHAIYYDLSYNLAQYLQSLDRIHRVGASEKFSAYYDFLLYEDTIDEDILDSLNKKAEKMYKIIDQDYQIYSLDMTEGNEEEEAYARLFQGK